MVKAVIDVGSNSVLLLVSEFLNGEWSEIHSATAITALGEGTKATGILDERAMRDTLAAIKQFWEIAQRLGAEKIIAGATMAARIASNRDELLTRAQNQGTPIKVLSGEIEAQLGFESVANDPKFKNAERISIIDPGGQSTELVTANRSHAGWEVAFRCSYAVGSLALQSGLLSAESCDGLALLRATSQVDAQIGLCYRPGQSGEVIVLGAAGTNLVSIRERLTSWQPNVIHGATLTYEEVSKAVGWLTPLTNAERAQIAGMEQGREKTIHLGSFILERFMFALRAEEAKVSIRGWRHALIEKDLDFVL